MIAEEPVADIATEASTETPAETSDKTLEETALAQAQERFFALVNGVAMMKLPDDLYIPPDALEVILDAFEGPLDLLLYLIRKNNLDILNIPIAEITRQYMTYVDLMKDLRLELAADYLVMAAMLAQIKSRMLLPRSEEAKEEEDPRAALVRRLQEYERFKVAAENLELLPREGREFFTQPVWVPPLEKTVLEKPPLHLPDLVSAFIDILKRSELIATHKVHRETLSIRERMSQILALVNEKEFVAFQACFTIEEGRMGVVVSFIAILELLRLGAINIVQATLFGPIHIKAVEDDDTADGTSSE